MAPAILPNDPIKPGIPAWKRLGLKLRSAQPVLVPYDPLVVVTPVAMKPKNTKRKRETPDQKSPRGKRINRSVKVHEIEMDTTLDQSPIASGLKQGKSVTFTPETKTEDGDSIKQLYNGWASKHQKGQKNFYQLRPKFAPKTSEPQQPSKQIDLTIDEELHEVGAAKKPRSENRAKKSKSPESHKITKQTRTLDPALSYLKLFHESRDTWKFNKLHQINLLKNAFDIDKIPSDYIEIFYKYIAGLKGCARTQLRDAAIAIKVKDKEEFMDQATEGMGSATSEQELEGLHTENVALETPSKLGYEERVLQPLTELTLKKRTAKRMRAERILEELAQEAHDSGEANGGSESANDEMGDPESQKRLKMSDGSTQRVRRKRKQRTTAVEDSSSSDSSDSDSSSEDESDDEPEQTDEESSSSSSSSSSTSEDDEDSESSESEGGANESE